ncbi:3-deoxy-7-phosphoheptulonate synthase [Aeromonas schubertii]|uniref:Phospho-2-dehydro-3-deoxyheptonate aldolase n=1 Tax=Aeromonas schubertii TaxID=652 RepID=A0ABS7VGC2_9GAMM|nr:3-deoxy-7-phosphoheptulonate synthase [Aeromonas schubertii]KUE79181.1 phospho-2-dehydro-3-deoxyheptonate aldolase [Aeromonas schubertii]MBZ6068432.1 3-deoxy-7-phosphoheptulonate synthase [Aeromonas schubertii]
MSIHTDELRTRRIGDLITPRELARSFPIDDETAGHLLTARREVEAILQGEDKRLLVIIGPCSIHDPEAALEYARRLVILRERYASSLCVVMRTYFEKPRTIIGWKGLINDPHLDGSFDVNQGLCLARKLLLEINQLGMPTATEFLDMVTGQYYADLITWGAIGARTTESQVHREMASALSCPVGFKNGTDGNLRIAIDAVRAARHSHIFYSPDKEGKMTIYRTAGNPHGHVILRGGHRPNYDTASIDEACEALAGVALPQRLVVDFSHGNSMKDHRRQMLVAEDICDQLRRGRSGIAGIMAESFLVEGRQEVVDGRAATFGQSITDACLCWESSERLVAMLAEASQARMSCQPR